MQKTQIQTQQYDCSRAKERVLVHLTIRELYDSRSGCAQKIHEAVTKFDCNGKGTCGVGTQTGPLSMSFDWSKCVHPEMQGRGS
jgi:hypothetical protein